MPTIAQINEVAPDFKLPGAYRGEARDFTLSSHRGRWVVLFFYPADFSFICPTEVKGFADRYPEFQSAEAEVLGVSTDGVESHLAWARELGNVPYPLLSDESKEVCRSYNALNQKEGVALRATFIIDPRRVMQYSAVTQNKVGRSVMETLRVLSALRTGKMCPADWQPGDLAYEGRSDY